MSIAINLIRTVLFAVWTLVIGVPILLVIYSRWLFGTVAGALGVPDAYERAIAGNARFTCWLAREVWAGVVLKMCGISVHVSEQIPVNWQRPHVICANHSSVFDILALVRVVPGTYRFVAKRELTKWPIIGWALRPAGQIVIDRKRREQAVASIAAGARLAIGGQVIFFVEGTRSRTGELLPFKKGAFHFAADTGTAILPTAIRGAASALGRMPWWHLRSGRTVDIVFCEPIPVSERADAEARRASVEPLRARTREVIETALLP